MASKHYSVNRQEDGTVIYEVDGALYTDPAQVTDEADRAVLAGLRAGRYGPDPQTGLVMPGQDPRAEAAETARMRTLFLCVFGAVAVIMLVAAAFTAYGAIRQSGTEVQAPGLVVDTVTETGYDGDNDLTEYSFPVVAFTDRDGVSRTVKIPEGSSPPAWQKGDAVTVLYDPGNPEHARTDSLSGTFLLWLVPGVTGIIGIGFSLAVILILRVMPAPQSP